MILLIKDIKAKLLSLFVLLCLSVNSYGNNYSIYLDSNTRNDSLLVNLIALDLSKKYEFIIEYNKSRELDEHFIRLSSDLYRSDKSTLSVVSRIMKEYSDIEMIKPWVKADRDDDGYYAIFFTEMDNQKYYLHVSVWMNEDADHSYVVIISTKSL